LRSPIFLQVFLHNPNSKRIPSAYPDENSLTDTY
jgi:hypothetical protein